MQGGIFIENGKENICFTTLHRLLNFLQGPTDYLFYPSDDERSRLMELNMIDLHDSNAAELEMFHRMHEAYKIKQEKSKD